MIATHKLTLKAGARTLVDQLDWQVNAGECWSIIGRNGAGKSTLMRTLAGLRDPDGGSVSIQGRLLAEWPLADLARQRAFLAQSRSDAFAYRAIETVRYAQFGIPLPVQELSDGGQNMAASVAHARTRDEMIAAVNA